VKTPKVMNFHVAMTFNCVYIRKSDTRYSRRPRRRAMTSDIDRGHFSFVAKRSSSAPRIVPQRSFFFLTRYHTRPRTLCENDPSPSKNFPSAEKHTTGRSPVSLPSWVPPSSSVPSGTTMFYGCTSGPFTTPSLSEYLFVYLFDPNCQKTAGVI